jgi:mannose-1-phosphate guanylyltransferase
MDPAHTYIVIMAGGGGTRLWPQSRRSRPKQYLPLCPGGETLLAATVRRVRPLCPIERTLVVTAAEQVAEVRRCVPELPVDNIIVEPIGRNTAPCIGLAALVAARRDPQAVLAVLPSDHYIGDEPAFQAVLARALEVAGAGHVVTIGVRPTRPETGYGYIQVGPGEGGVHVAESFTEKPDAERAARYLQAGTYLWNSGTFFFPARRIRAEIDRHLPPLSALLAELAEHPERLGALYGQAPAISIDYAVMERLGRQHVSEAEAIRVVAGDFGWNDVGSFTALCDLHPSDEAGNQAIGGGPAPLFHEAARNLVFSTTPQLVVCAHVEDLLVAVTEEAILVLPKARAQEVREVVACLKESGRSEYL